MIKLLCKQCKQEFELTDSEIQFYKSKGLTLPKRCKTCRERNKEEILSRGIKVDMPEVKKFPVPGWIAIPAMFFLVIFLAIALPDYKMKTASPVMEETAVITETETETETLSVIETVLPLTETETETVIQTTAPPTETETVRQPTIPPAEKPEITYVLNTYRKKFHYPDCDSVTQMNAENREYFYGTREEAVAMGYSPCGNCRP